MLLTEMERHNVNKTFVIALYGWNRTEGHDFEEAILSFVRLTKFAYNLLRSTSLTEL